MTQSAATVLNNEFLNIRCRLLDIAASLDRIERAEGVVQARSDPRLAKLKEATGILADTGKDRAERVQMFFSLPYDENWQRR